LPLIPKIQMFVQGLYSTSGVDGLPIDFKTVCSDGSQQYFYRTRMIDHETLPASAFDYPAKFIKVGSVADTLVGDREKKNVADLVNSIMQVETEDKNPKSPKP